MNSGNTQKISAQANSLAATDLNRLDKMRVEKDSMGELRVPLHARYGAQTQRAINNFPISGQSMPVSFIRALLLIKWSAAKANMALQQLDEAIGSAICLAADQLLDDEHLMTHFPVDVFQTGSGTSSNMNANEVLASMASETFNGRVDANDHVNYGQSSNDTIPTAIHVSAAIELSQCLLPALEHLRNVIQEKSQSLESVVKTGRTHLMDAMPVRMSQSLESWVAQLSHHHDQLVRLQPSVQTLAQGGTAVGTGVNAHPTFAETFGEILSRRLDLPFQPANNFFSLIGSQDVMVSLSGHLKAVAVTLMKIANDLRWMNSGPLAGLGEIELEALQPGSSIMPGKVNPVIPEAVAMVAAQVIGNDSAVTVAGQSGNFELNVMLPLVANNILQSLGLLTNASHLLADKAIATFTVREEQLQMALTRNPILVTALNPIIGYAKAAEIAKQAYAEGRKIIDVAEEKTDIHRDELERLLDPKKLTEGGIP